MPRAAKATTKSTTKSTGKSTSKSTTSTSAKSTTKAKAKAKATTKAKASTKAKTAAKTKTSAKAKATKTTKAKSRRSAQSSKTARSAGKSSASAGIEFKNFVPYKPKRGEDYMSEAQRAHFKTILLNWKTELMEEVDRTVTHMKDEAANFPDPADRATQEEEFSLELRTRDRERKLIKKIDSTIELLEQDDYGFCEACGVEIGIQRLEARPTATQCIDCKTLAEIKERQELG